MVRIDSDVIDDIDINVVTAKPFNPTASVSAVWVYSPPSTAIVDNIVKMNTYLEAAGAPTGINRIYFSLSPQTNDISQQLPYTNVLAEFVSYANSKEIFVHGMTLQDVGVPSYGGALSYVNQIITYNANNPKATFYGIHIDVEEPDSDPNPGAFMNGSNGYVGLLKQLSPAIEKADLDFSAAIEYGWLTSGLTTVDILQQYLDELVPMMYSDEPFSANYASANDILEAYPPAKYITVPTIIGFGARDCAGFPANGFPYNNSRGWAEAIPAIATMQNRLAQGAVGSGTNYLGTSIFKYEEIALPTFTPGGQLGE
jgi:hypothetical protein